MRVVIKILFVAVVFFLLVSLPYAWAASSSDYPKKPVNMIVPYPPGGGVDNSGRAMAEAIKPFFPQPIVIVNRSGGGGSVGAAEAILAKPDGYTIGYVVNTHLTLQPHRTQLPYKTTNDYRPVINIFNLAYILAVNSDSPWKTLKEFVDYAKGNPGKIRVGLAGLGIGPHLDTEILKEKAGINLTIVPYTGDAEAAPQLLGGHIEAMFCNPASLIGHARAGRVRFLALAAEKRYRQFPDIPTFRELGYDVCVPSRYLIIVPKRTPDHVVETLYEAFRKAVETEPFKDFADKNFFDISIIGPADLKRALDQDYIFFGDLVRKLNLKD